MSITNQSAFWWAMPMIVRSLMAIGVTAYQVPIGRIILINTWLAYHSCRGVSMIPKPTSFFANRLITERTSKALYPWKSIAYESHQINSPIVITAAITKKAPYRTSSFLNSGGRSSKRPISFHLLAQLSVIERGSSFYSSRPEYNSSALPYC